MVYKGLSTENHIFESCASPYKSCALRGSTTLKSSTVERKVQNSTYKIKSSIFLLLSQRPCWRITSSQHLALEMIAKLNMLTCFQAELWRIWQLESNQSISSCIPWEFSPLGELDGLHQCSCKAMSEDLLAPEAVSSAAFSAFCLMKVAFSVTVPRLHSRCCQQSLFFVSIYAGLQSGVMNQIWVDKTLMIQKKNKDIVLVNGWKLPWSVLAFDPTWDLISAAYEVPTKYEEQHLFND